MVEEVITAEAVSNTTSGLPPPAGGVLQCAANRLRSDGHRTKARLDDDVAANAARRLGTLAILTAVTVVGMTLLQSVLQEKMRELVTKLFARFLRFEALVILVHAGNGDDRNVPIEEFDDVSFREDVACCMVPIENLQQPRDQCDERRYDRECPTCGKGADERLDATR